MAKTETNLRASETFIKTVLERNFNQKVEDEALKSAAKKLCEALPESRARKAA